jgi:peptidylprolyl isomerase
VLVVVAIVGVALLISVLGRDDDDQVATEATDDQTTEPTDTVPDDAPPTAPPPSPDDYSDPEIAAEVLDRGPPEDVEGPPEDLPADELEIETLVEGEGRRIREGDQVVVHYYGVLADGTSFDDSWSRGQPFPLTVPGGVIDGWNEGLLGARAGERRRLDIGSDLAYGPQGQPPTIPPEAPLGFVVDVVDVVRAEAPGGDAGNGGTDPGAVEEPATDDAATDDAAATDDDAAATDDGVTDDAATGGGEADDAAGG